MQRDLGGEGLLESWLLRVHRQIVHRECARGVHSCKDSGMGWRPVACAYTYRYMHTHTQTCAQTCIHSSIFMTFMQTYTNTNTHKYICTCSGRGEREGEKKNARRPFHVVHQVSDLKDLEESLRICGLQMPQFDSPVQATGQHQLGKLRRETPRLVGHARVQVE